MKKRAFNASISLLCAFLVLFILMLPVSALASAHNEETALAFSYAFEPTEKAMLASEPSVKNLFSALPASLTPSELSSLRLYPGGVPFGIKFITQGVVVVGFCTNEGRNAAADLRINDRILAIDGKTIRSAEELCSAVAQSGGRALKLSCMRGDREFSVSLLPYFSESENRYSSGILVKDSGAGIGTVTYICPQTLAFGGLGHGICESGEESPTPIRRGSVVDVTISGINKGVGGSPGELRGYFRSGKVGSLLMNSSCGVFGVLSSLPKDLPSEPLALCPREELKEGKAYIFCTLDENQPTRYEIEISHIDTSSHAGRSFTVRVTDPRLIEKTGGIVQGMSGSPIIQDGRLAGAVTHVLINDPTVGYGIFIENMLSDMSGAPELSAA